MRLRKTAPSDIPALKELWKAAFSEKDEDISDFFEMVYPTAMGFCAEEDGQLAAMLYALPVVLAGGETESAFFAKSLKNAVFSERKAAYVYAVATAEQYRRKGVCKKLMEFAEKELRKRYFSCVMLVPADETLTEYYRKNGYLSKIGTEKLAAELRQGCGKAAADVAESIAAKPRQASGCALGTAEYAGLRETLLSDRLHVRYPKALLDYEEKRAALYRLEDGYALGCAAVRVEDGTAFVEELLPDERMLPALRAAVKAERFVWHRPGAGLMPAMEKWLDGTAPAEPVYLAFAFD